MLRARRRPVSRPPTATAHSTPAPVSAQGQSSRFASGKPRPRGPAARRAVHPPRPRVAGEGPPHREVPGDDRQQAADPQLDPFLQGEVVREAGRDGALLAAGAARGGQEGAGAEALERALAPPCAGRRARCRRARGWDRRRRASRGPPSTMAAVATSAASRRAPSSAPASRCALRHAAAPRPRRGRREQRQQALCVSGAGEVAVKDRGRRPRPRRSRPARPARRGGRAAPAPRSPSWPARTARCRCGLRSAPPWSQQPRRERPAPQRAAARWRRRARRAARPRT